MVLRGNKLTGLPAEPGGLLINSTCTNCLRTSLRRLDLSHNQIAGTLPAGKTGDIPPGL